jgi:hypothetical protein
MATDQNFQKMNPQDRRVGEKYISDLTQNRAIAPVVERNPWKIDYNRGSSSGCILSIQNSLASSSHILQKEI